VSASKGPASLTEAKRSNPALAAGIESMMQQALLLAVEKLGGTWELPIQELDHGPIGKTMDMTHDRERGLFVFHVRPSA
jgi:hypothetical protein